MDVHETSAGGVLNSLNKLNVFACGICVQTFERFLRGLMEWFWEQPKAMTAVLLLDVHCDGLVRFAGEVNKS